MLSIIKKYWLYLILGFLATILLLINLLIKKTTMIEVDSVSPAPKATQVKLDTNIQINFTNKISPDQIKIWSQPEIKYQLDQSDEKQISLVLQNFLQTNTNYQIKVFDQKEQLLFSWQFLTEEIVSNPLAAQKASEWEQENHPLGKYLPWENDNFKIYYTGPKKIEVIIKNQDIDVIKSEVRDWINSKDVDPDSHQINWQRS